MNATKIARADARVTETPNASMTTLASPTQGGTATLSLWRTSMRAGQRGPQHRFDVEQAWHLLDGTAQITTDAKTIDMTEGDTLVIPAGSTRQVETKTGAVFIVCGIATGLATAASPSGSGDPVAPAWIG